MVQKCGRLDGPLFQALVRNLLPEERLIPEDMVSIRDIPFRRLSCWAVVVLVDRMRPRAPRHQIDANAPLGRARYPVNLRFRMGLHLLPSVAWMDVRDAHSASIRQGHVVRLGFGFTADVMFADNYAVGTGVNVSSAMGARWPISTGRPQVDPTEDAANDSTEVPGAQRPRTLTQHWVEVPMSFKFRTREIGHITYWGQFGLGLGAQSAQPRPTMRWTTSIVSW